MESLNLTNFITLLNNQTKKLHDINNQLFYDYLEFRKTQAKKCNTTPKKIMEDIEAQQEMLGNGQITIKMFYRAIQFAIYHQINKSFIEQQRIFHPQKLVNLSDEISYFDIFELTNYLSNKLGIEINPNGLIKLTEHYINQKYYENKAKQDNKLYYLNIIEFNKSLAKERELLIDFRMYYDYKISLKIIHLAIQFLCEHLLKFSMAEIGLTISINTSEIYLNSCHHKNQKYETTYDISNVTTLFSYYLEELSKLGNKAA